MDVTQKRQGKEPAPVEDMFPKGMHVLAVDDDPVCLKVLEFLLRSCKYQPTMVMDARMALKMLREAGEGEFDLVITDVHMPDMDGFMLLEIINHEMNLPVIMLSVDGEKETMVKGITLGACDYLVKPVHIKELKNIWQHVVRKNLGGVNHISKDDAYQMVQPGIKSVTKSKKCSKKKNDGDDSDENKESTLDVANRKKPRLSWTRELHDRFMEVFNRLGAERAAPKTILQMMNVDYLTRDSVASHLQKYRLYLKSIIDDPRKSNYLSDSSRRRNSLLYMDMNRQGSSMNFHEHQRGQTSSVFPFRGSSTHFAAPSVLGDHGVSSQSINLPMGTIVNGGSMLRHAVSPDARRCHASSPPINSFAKVSDCAILDASLPGHFRKSYANILREKILESSSVVPSSHHSSSFADMPNGGILDRANPFHVQPPELGSQFASQMNMAPSTVGARHSARFPCLVGSSSNLWDNMTTSSFPGHMDGIPLAQLEMNIPHINPLPSFEASPGQIQPMFQNEQQNQMEEIIINNNTPLDGFSEKMVPFNMASNTTPIEMTIDTFSPMTQMINVGNINSALSNLQPSNSFAPTQMVNGGSTGSTLPEPRAGTCVAPTQMVNGGNTSSTLHEPRTCSCVSPTQMVNGRENACCTLPMQVGLVDQQALADQPCYSNPFFIDDTFASMLNEDFNDDAFFGGGC